MVEISTHGYEAFSENNGGIGHANTGPVNPYAIADQTIKLCR